MQRKLSFALFVFTLSLVGICPSFSLADCNGNGVADVTDNSGRYQSGLQ